ncbi:MAG: flagellar filament capping protein FliD [Nevskiales bacterium]|nr:flagellar filament capping protein FliD [Nevskiales bacterium]
MASISSAGIGSGLDVNSLVAQLVAAERTPSATRLSTAQSKINVQISAFGSFKGVLSGLKSTLDALKSDGAVAALKATSSDEAVFTASATADAAPGSYDIEVVSLATASKQVSAAYAGGPTTALGAGDVQISVGANAFTVSLTSGSDSLADLRDAINNAADNTGVTATLVNETNGTRLLLTSNETGTDHAVSVSSSLITLTDKQVPTDAHVRVEGYDVYSQTNSITDAIDGVTLDLQSASPGTTLSLDVAIDSDAASKAIDAFVKAYNNTVQIIGSLTKYDTTTGTAAALTGDSTVRGASQQLRTILGSTVATNDTFTYLSEIGITTETDGTLKLDSAKLSEALATDRSAVAALFSGADGYATRLSDMLEGYVGTDGQIEAKTDGLNDRLDDIKDQQEALDRRMAAVEARYLKQFTALDTLISQMQSTSSYLSQQLASLPGAAKSSG